MTPREWLRFTVESSYKTKKATPVLGTDMHVIRLDEGNAFTYDPSPLFWEIPYGGGIAVTALAGTDREEVKWGIKTKAYYSQLALLMGAGITRVNAGKTAPWTQTTERAGDLASFALDHAWMLDDGTIQYEVLLGCKVDKLTFEIGSNQRVGVLSIEGTAAVAQPNSYDGSAAPTSTNNPTPADTDYPTDPVVFKDSAGGLTCGSVRTNYDSIKLAIDNKNDPRFDEFAMVQRIRSLGRDATVDLNLFLKASPDDRVAMEAVTAQTVTLVFTNSVKTLTLGFKGQNFFNKRKRDFPLDKDFYAAMSLKNKWDNSVGTDVSIAVV